MDTCDCITTSQSHLAPISEVRFQPGTNIFATSSSDKAVKLWDSNKVRVFFFSFQIFSLPFCNMSIHSFIAWNSVV